MLPLFSNPSAVPAFLIKLWKLVEDQTTNELIEWNANGSSFVVNDSVRFAKELLPLYFKHNNFGSFVRQLNMYGFKKVMHYGKVNDSSEVEFQHAFFSKDKVELLANIKRRIGASKGGVPDCESGFNAKDILSNLSTLKEKQRAMDTTLNKMKKENEILWRELATVRQRHKAQEQILTKVIQFLVQIIQRSNQNIHVPRKLARMLQDSSMSKENSTQVARIVDVLRNNDSDCFITPDEVPKNSASAVIQEVTDTEPDISCSQSPDYSLLNTSVLKPASKRNNPNAFTFGKHNAAGSSLEPLSVLDKLHNNKTTIDKKSSTKGNDLPTRFVAVPIEGDSNKLILVPIENFTEEEISSLSKDSLCNVISVPDNDSDSDPKSLSKPTYMDYEFNDGLSNILRDDLFPKDSALNESRCSVSNLEEISSRTSSSEECDDLLLSDLLQASKISSSLDELIDLDTVEILPTLNNKEIMNLKTKSGPVLEKCNNQVAIPSPSSIVKSTKSFYPDFNILQDPVNSSNIDMQFLEQILSNEDSINPDSFINSKHEENSINLSFDDVVGNELVQFTPSLLDENKEQDQLQWLDFLPQDSYNPEADLNNSYFCGPKDLDVLIQSNDTVISQNIEAVKKETLLTTSQISTGTRLKKNKRRKVK